MMWSGDLLEIGSWEYEQKTSKQESQWFVPFISTFLSRHFTSYKLLRDTHLIFHPSSRTWRSSVGLMTVKPSFIKLWSDRARHAFGGPKILRA